MSHPVLTAKAVGLLPESVNQFVHHPKTSILISPCGGRLVDLMVPAEAVDELKAHANQLPSLQLSDRSVCDLELLATGGARR